MNLSDTIKWNRKKTSIFIIHVNTFPKSDLHMGERKPWAETCGTFIHVFPTNVPTQEGVLTTHRCSPSLLREVEELGDHRKKQTHQRTVHKGKSQMWFNNKKRGNPLFLRVTTPSCAKEGLGMGSLACQWGWSSALHQQITNTPWQSFRY